MGVFFLHSDHFGSNNTMHEVSSHQSYKRTKENRVLSVMSDYNSSNLE